MTIRRNRSAIFIERAREMRHQPNGVEALVWNALRDRRLGGLKFRRQYAFGSYIDDFYCAEAKLILELDGNTHDGKEDYDAQRDAWMESQGLFVLRIPNLELNDGLEQFLEVAHRLCVERSGQVTRTTSPSP